MSGIQKINWRTPTEKLTGETPDISVFRFHFWQEVEWYDTTAKNPHDGWTSGRFLGINDSAGDSMTYFIETLSPRGRPTVITRSNVRSKHDNNRVTDVGNPHLGENDHVAVDDNGNNGTMRGLTSVTDNKTLPSVTHNSQQ